MNQVRKERERLGYSQQQLAELAKISQPFLCEIETGAKRPSLDTMQKLAAALGCTIDELVRERSA